MWLLTCDGDLFAHRPQWLRPGTRHLLGRTTSRAEGGERIRYIDQKSVSRKHLVVHIGSVKPGDSSRVHARSEIKVEECSKVGTFFNGEKIMKTTKILDKSEYTIKLGQYEHLFHLKWTPVVFTVHNLTKKEKAKSDPLEAYRQKVEKTEIKLITDYVANTTTHVLASRRNTPVGLQALLQGRWLVTHSFVDAMAKATAHVGGDRNGEPQLSPLEQDFQANWPSEEEYIVPAGVEPSPKPNELLRPNSARGELFAHFSFVFLSQQQFDLLLPVVTTGGGKAFLSDVDVGKTTVSSVVSQVKAIAGSKGNADFKLSQYTGKGGVAVVRLSHKDDLWTRDFLNSLDRDLERRSMEQSEFLAAILSLDTSDFCQPLLERATPSQEVNSQAGASYRQTSQPPHATRTSFGRDSQQLPTPESEQRQHPQPAENSMAEPPSKKPNRLITQSRFKGFDEPDPSQYVFQEAEDPDPSQAPSGQEDMDVDASPQPSQPVASQRASRKRPAPDDDDMQQRERETMDNMLPGAAAMKRLKTEALQESGRAASVGRTPEAGTRRTMTATAKLAAALPKKKKEKQIDVRAELETRRKAEDEARQKDEEALREQLAGVDISTVHAVVETYEVPLRQPPARRTDAGPSDRWDPAWNGRKNFKRFRPQGQGNDGPRLPRVIVTLEEVPRKSHGLGDDYWLDPPTASTKKTQSQSQSQAARPGSSEDDPNRFRRRIQNSRIEDEEAAEREEFRPENIAGRPRDRAIQEAIDSTPSQTLGTESQRRAAGKRPAARQDGPPAKKARATKAAPARQTVTIDDDEDDGLKFRRRRK